MIRFIDAHRAAHGVEPICAVLPIAPSTYFRVRAQQHDAHRRPARAQRDAALRVAIQRVYDANFGVYGPRKVWRAIAPGGPRCGPMHGRAVDARDGIGWGGAGAAPGPSPPVSARS